MRPAVFLDRDGTLIEHVHHLSDPGDVRLIDGAAEAVAELRAAGYSCVVVTNQSVIGRGKLTVEGLREIHDVMHRQLAVHGVYLDGLYFCPRAPKQDDPTAIEHPDRKPGTGMLLRAASELNLDLGCSWMVGDSISDMLAGRNAGCRGCILVRTGFGSTIDARHEAIDYVVDDLCAASELILKHDEETVAAQPRIV